MKVLQVNCSNKGSTGKIMHAIADGIRAEGHESVICYSFGSTPDAKYSEYQVSKRYEAALTHRLSNVTGYPYGLAWLSTRKLLKIIDMERPDIVHLHCPNSNMNVYQILRFLKKRDFPTVLTNHCEMFYTGNCPYSYACEKWKSGCGNCNSLKNALIPNWYDGTAKSWIRMKRCFECFKRLSVTSVSRWVHERSANSPILSAYDNQIVENGIDTGTYHRCSEDKIAIKKSYSIDANKKIVIFVTAQFVLDKENIKGGYYFVELAKRMLSVNSDIEFLLVGAKKVNAELPKNIRLIGRVENENKLSELYGIADLTMVVSRKETYSMPCAESLCCGTPVVGFFAGGPESISIPEYSEFCEYGDLDALTTLIEQWICYKTDEKEVKICQDAEERYGMLKMNSAYLSVYKKLLQEG